MFELSLDYIQHQVADSAVIFQRGSRLYKQGLYNCTEADPKQGSFIYEIDGSFGDYTTRVYLTVAGGNLVLLRCRRVCGHFRTRWR